MKNGTMHDTAPLDTAILDTYRSQIARLPLTMRPALNQQVSGWDDLFPFEQKRVAAFLHAVSSFSNADLEALTQPLRVLEEKMGVPRWNFSTSRDTMQNASLLARSSYYIEWRGEVQKIFSAIESRVHAAAPSASTAGRLVLLVLPEHLPIKSINAPKKWDSRGREYRISGDARRICEMAMRGQYSLPAQLAAAKDATASDCWLIDADAQLGSFVPASSGLPASQLNYATLRPFRDSFLAAVNAVPKDLAASDEILEHVRQQNWDKLWPAELAGQARLRNFMIELFLSGNGALIFSSAFVQWTASEALRRARPRLMVGRFGMRSKPKPFTSIAIFENQQTINKLQEVDDPEGSAIDALILARYVWLSALRYPEEEHTCCVCVSEAANSVYVVAPDSQRPGWQADQAVTPDELCTWMHEQLANS